MLIIIDLIKYNYILRFFIYVYLLIFLRQFYIFAQAD